MGPALSFAYHVMSAARYQMSGRGRIAESHKEEGRRDRDGVVVLTGDGRNPSQDVFFLFAGGGGVGKHWTTTTKPTQNAWEEEDDYGGKEGRRDLEDG